MKKRIYIVAALILIAIVVMASCNKNHEKKVDAAEENVAKANKELISARVDYTNEWQQFKDEANSRIKANQDRIEKFKADLKTADGKAKLKYEKEVGILEQKNIELGKRLDAFKYDSKNNWEDFKRNFSHDADELGKTLKSVLPGKN
jgi:hypothetical protein